MTRVGDRQVFQFGALGGITADEFHHGSPRVAAYLRRYGSALRRWDPPPADGQAPEAEWGFDSVLLEDLRDLAHRRGLRLRRIVFDDPEDLSPHVADLYRWWYRRRGRPTGRLLVASFVLFDPWWAIRAGAVPLWLKFAVERSAQRLEDHLAGCEPYDDIRLTLFSHGTDSAGIAPIERWQSILAYAPGRASFFGVDPRRFPQDFASFGRFHRQLRALAVKDRPPDALTLEELDLFIEQGRRYDGVSLIDEEL